MPTATNPQTGEKLQLVGDKWEPIKQTATNPETGEQLALVGGQWRPIEKQSPIAGGLNALLQGLSLGGADEAASALEAGVKKFLGPPGYSYTDEYNRLLAEQQKGREQFATDYPKTSTGLNVAGAIGTGVASAPLAAGKGLLGLATLGATEGGIAGGLSAPPGERLQGAGTGALIGGVLPPLAAGVGKAYQGIKNVIKPSAVSKLREAAKGIGTSADEVSSNLAQLGPKATLSDVSPGFLGQAQGIAGKTPGTRAIVDKGLTPRIEGLTERLVKVVRSAPGEVGDVFDDTMSMISNRAQLAKPLYDEAYSQPIAKTIQGTQKVTKTLKKLLKTDAVQKALPRAKKIASNEFRELPEEGLENAPLKVWDDIKRGLDDEIGANVDEFGKLNETGRSVLNVKNRLLEVLDTNQAYKAARDSYSGESAMMNSYKFGQNILNPKVTTGEVRALLKNATESEKDSLLNGAMSSIKQKIGSVKEDTLSATNALRVPNNKDKITAIIGEKEFNKLAGFVDKELIFRRTQQQVVGGSATQLRQAGERSVSKGVAAGAEDTTKSGLINRAIDSLGSLTGISKKESEKLARLLATPEGSQDAIKLLREAGVKDESIGPIIKGWLGVSTAASQQTGAN